MRISDWSSDVCSSDLVRALAADADYLAVAGENRKLVIFPLSEIPVMARGQGVMLQRYRDGGLSDATGFRLADGLSWTMGGDTGRTRTETDLLPWRADRGAAGRMPPNGFPRDNPLGGRAASVDQIGRAAGRGRVFQKVKEL